MKNFLSSLLATILGIVISSVLLFFIFIIIISALVASSDKALEIKPNTILTLKLDAPVVDREPAMPFNLGSLMGNKSAGLNDILANIKKAKEDKNIEGIYLNLSFIPSGISTIEEIRNALIDFRTSGKFVITHAEALSQGAYYLATASDAVYLSPVGIMEWVGIRTQSPFFKNTLDKLDIDATVIRYGKFKSAAESFTEEGYSKENREQLSKLITSVWDNVCVNVEDQRNIPAARLREIADNLLVKTAFSAYELGLVDSLLYEGDVLEILKDKSGLGKDDDIRVVSIGDYKRVAVSKNFKGVAKDKIAVIYASGDIIDTEGNEQAIGSEKYASAIRKARKDSTIKAIVLRVNSPGGSAIASDAIWHELNLARRVKPLVVSMGDVAASGGYYISCMADTILAQPNTITGSIGVIGLPIHLAGMFNKIGVTFDVEKTGKYSDLLSATRPVTDFELAYFQNMIDSVYVTFVNRVDSGRSLNFSQIDAIGQGRIWSGTDALEIGLIDKIGGLEDAIEIAKNMAGLGERYRIIELPEQEDPLVLLVKTLSGEVSQRAVKKDLGPYSDYYYSIQRIINSKGVLTRLPFDITVY